MEFILLNEDMLEKKTAPKGSMGIKNFSDKGIIMSFSSDCLIGAFS